MDRPHSETRGVGFHIIFVEVIVRKKDRFFSSSFGINFLGSVSLFGILYK